MLSFNGNFYGSPLEPFISYKFVMRSFSISNSFPISNSFSILNSFFILKSFSISNLIPITSSIPTLNSISISNFIPITNSIRHRIRFQHRIPFGFFLEIEFDTYKEFLLDIKFENSKDRLSGEDLIVCTFYIPENCVIEKSLCLMTNGRIKKVSSFFSVVQLKGNHN